MSFILDALKKSESDRQRQSGPALFEVKVAPPRTRLPLWALALALLLVVNAAVVAWMLLRHPGAHAQSAGDTSAAAATAAAAAPASVTVAPPPAVPVPAPPVPATPVTPQLAAASSAPGASLTPQAAPSGAAPVPAPAAAAGNDVPNPEDLVPAAEPGPGLTSHVHRGTADGVPLYQDWAATPGTRVPQLRLDLHVYAARPQDRFVMINMKKLREGDSLPEGVRVESITPEGAVLSFSGSRFLLPRD